MTPDVWPLALMAGGILTATLSALSLARLYRNGV